MVQDAWGNVQVFIYMNLAPYTTVKTRDWPGV